MKGTISFFVLASMLLSSAVANAQTTDRPECTNAILNGSYAVNADCRGSASLEKTPLGTANWEFVIVGHGDEVLQIATTPPRETVMWVLKKQFSR